MEEDNNVQEEKVIVLEQKYQELLNDLDRYDNEIPEQLVQNILDQKGFYTDDELVYKMIGCLGDKMLHDIMSSIANLRYKDIEKSKQNKKDKKLAVLTTKDIVSELYERGLQPQEVFYPNLQPSIEEQIEHQEQQEKQQKQEQINKVLEEKQIINQ